jgi:hypothetical protein
MNTYGHPSEAGARSRLLALWDEEVKLLRSVSGATRAQES